MPLVKRDHHDTRAALPPVAAIDPQIALANPDPDLRRAAIWSLRGRHDAVALMEPMLGTEGDASVLEAVILSLTAIGDDRAVALLARLARAEDPLVRFGALEALRDLGPAAGQVFQAMVHDPDPHMRILAAEIARGALAAGCLATLEAALATEQDVNVCCAYIDVLSEIGTAATVPALEALGRRMGRDHCIRFVIDAALDRLPRP